MILNSILIPPTPKHSPEGNNIAIQISPELVFNYWDLWCLICADEKFGGSLASLKDHLISQRTNKPLCASSTSHHLEDTITHLEELEPRANSLSPFKELLAALPLPFYRKERHKAERNIIRGFGGYPLSESMLRSPRRLLEKEAMRGQWRRLPFDPTPIAERIRPLLIPKKDHFFPKSASFALARRVARAIEKELKSSDPLCNIEAHQYAVYRAALTLYQEENCWDDSYGTMGELGKEWVKAILLFNPDRCRSFPEPFLKDLLMFLVWENYGLVYSEQVAEYIQNLSDPEKEISKAILKDIASRAEKGFQTYRATTARCILEKVTSAI
jgi:hypothetical protein